MAGISLTETPQLMYPATDPLQSLQVNPKYNHISYSNQNFSSMIQKLLYQFRIQNNPKKEKSPPEPPPDLEPTKSTIIHLVRPKSTQQIDLDSILKKKKSQPKKKSTQNNPNSPKINRSYSYVSYNPLIFEPHKNIFTPDWTVNKSETIQNEYENKNFNIIQAHSRIEVFEYRIQMGEDENHLHPALARIAAESADDDNFTKIEKDKATRYEEKKIEQKVPLFWPPRVYDNEENKMTEQESSKLEQIIQKEIESVGKPKENQKKKIAKSRSIPLPSLLPSANKKKASISSDKKRKVGRPPKFSTFTNFYFSNFITDDDDDLTDLDF